MAPMDQVLSKLAVQSIELTPAVLQSAAAMDLFEHIKRIRESDNKLFSAQRLQNASEEFMRVFFEDVFQGIYHGKVVRLLGHEKILRSAFHLYIRRQIPRKPQSSMPQVDAVLQPATVSSVDEQNDLFFSEDEPDL